MIRSLKSRKTVYNKRLELHIAKILNPILSLSSSGIVLLHNLMKKAGVEYNHFTNILKDKIKRIIPDTYKSNLISYFFRPVFEHKRIRVIFGVNLIAFILVSEIISSSASAAFPNIESLDSENEEISVVQIPKEVIVTEETYQIPFETLGISQGFASYHPGVDLRAPYGTEIRPINDGIVTEAYRSLYGYGQAIIIEHPGGYSSLYAHVNQISVEKGFDVDKNTIIAKVGMTGYTTGPHLHLEIYQEGKALNPKPILGY